MRVIAGLLAVLGLVRVASAVDPYPREMIVGKAVVAWEFPKPADAWKAMNHCTAEVAGGELRVRATAEDPYLASPPVELRGPVLAVVRIRSTAGGAGQIFWAEKGKPFAEERSARFDLMHDGTWQEVRVFLPIEGTANVLRMDPASGSGEVQIDRVELLAARLHPIEVLEVQAGPAGIRAKVKNHDGQAHRVRVNGEAHELGAGAETTVTAPVRPRGSFTTQELTLAAGSLPAVRRSVTVYDERAEAKWVEVRSGELAVRLVEDGSGGVISRGGRAVALLVPVSSSRDGRAPAMKRVASDETSVRFEGDGVMASVSVEVEEIRVAVEGSRGVVEGPVVRAMGELRQGVFAGLEYLGAGEASSSTLDIDPPDNRRFEPDPLKVTMPLMAVVTERASVGVTWEDMTLRPVFASPNVYDGAADHRMALRGKRIEAVVRVTTPAAVEELVLWGVRRRGGLPELPKRPRTEEQQREIVLRALNGPLRTAEGWGHCIEPQWERRPFADIASTLFRVTGRVPELPKLVPGGGHLVNDSIYFVSGRAEEWLRLRKDAADRLIGQQREDGSFRYSGKFLRGHYEDTASGYCGAMAERLLQFAAYTGDKRALEAGVKTLEYMKGFDVPRGAQTWELSLHTPDIMASAHLVRAYTLGYELSGKKEFLTEARRWALSGVPFVYLWGDRPIMRYATVPVYGATNWRAPNWIGLPVQWCGVVYARALVDFAPYDQTLDWAHLARGILVAAEQIQYPDGERAGCLPDIFRLESQSRDGPTINPATVESLRRAVEREPEGLYVGVDGPRRVVSPFPVTVNRGRALVRTGMPGLKYQVLVNGQHVVEVVSTGEDELDLGQTKGK